MTDGRPKITIDLVEEDSVCEVDTRPNYLRIRHGMYLIRTQAGFRKAVRDFSEEHGLCRNSIDKYPSAYPCLVTMHSTYTGGGHDISVRVMKLNTLLSILRSQGEIE